MHTKPEVPAGGIQDLIYRVYDGKWTKLPVYDELKPVKLGQLAEGLIDIRVAGKPDYYGVVFEGILDVKVDSEYTFKLASDDGGRLIIDDKRVIDHDGLHELDQNRDNSVNQRQT